MVSSQSDKTICVWLLDNIAEGPTPFIEWLLVLRVTPIKRVTFEHRDCSLFSRFLVFDISLHRLLFYLPPPILLRVTFSLTLQTPLTWFPEVSTQPTWNMVFVVNTGSIFKNYHWRLILQSMVYLLIPYMTRLLLALVANSPKEM